MKFNEALKMENELKTISELEKKVNSELRSKTGLKGG